MLFTMGDAKTDDEATFDYTIEDGPSTLMGKTHILVVEFPDDCDEECFLLAVKHYIKAQSQNLRNIQDGVAGH